MYTLYDSHVFDDDMLIFSEKIASTGDFRILKFVSPRR